MGVQVSKLCLTARLELEVTESTDAEGPSTGIFGWFERGLPSAQGSAKGSETNDRVYESQKVSFEIKEIADLQNDEVRLSNKSPNTLFVEYRTEFSCSNSVVTSDADLCVVHELRFWNTGETNIGPVVAEQFEQIIDLTD